MSNSSKIYDRGDTIAAIATPPGEGGVAIVRISGPKAVPIADQLFSGKVASYSSHTAHFGRVFDEEVIDEALILPMLGERSYTGEDTIEIQCHGGSLVARQVLETALKRGARAAGPGEFTFRAFMNGRIDLAQAEAVQELIHARNEWAVGSAADHLCGRLSERIVHFQKELTEVAALFEAWVDFPEEGLEFSTEEELLGQLRPLVGEMEGLASTFHDGRIVQEGIELCIVGLPNVGKSSLMNALLERDRAIVTDIPGTTRDLLEDHLLLGGLHLRLVDTAGIRKTEEVVEQEGIRRSRKAMERADLVLLVLDASQPLSEADRELLVPDRKTILVWNKIDLGREGMEELPFHFACVSARKGEGIEALKRAIDEVIWEKGPPTRNQLLITKLRHKEALDEAIAYVKKVVEGLESGLSPEFLTLDVRSALVALGAIIGTEITEEILSAIFRRFCIGK